MTNFITVMATEALPIQSSDPVWLRPWQINADAVLAIVDCGSSKLAGEGAEVTTPIACIYLPGLILYASGVAEELIARTR